MNKERTFTELAAEIDRTTQLVTAAKHEVEQADAEVIALLAKQEAELETVTKVRFDKNAALTAITKTVNDLHKEMHNKLTGAKVDDTPKPDPTTKELKDLYLTVQKGRK